MGYCEAAADRFELIADPYNNKRICYKNKYDFFERLDLIRIMEDTRFLFIKDNIVYFERC